MTEINIEQIQSDLQNGKVTSEALVQRAINNFEDDKKSAIPLNAFLEIYENVLDLAKKADEEISSAIKADGGKPGTACAALFSKKPLLGIPFSVKDNISVKGRKLTCSSKILQGYVAPYNATVTQRLIDSGAIPIGRCNQDEFAMGSSTEYSIYGPTRNPINREYVSGGSSGGPAATVAANYVPFALGTETGGSVRLPASYCGIYGLKTTYGVLSRWGVVAYGSSLDQVGLFGHSPKDIALPLSILSGIDTFDDTSVELPKADELKNLKPMSNDEIKGLKIAIPKQFLETKGMDSDVTKVFDQTREWFLSKGATIEIVDLPVLNASIASYYVIALSEAASNLSRFDGIRYGNRQDPGEGFDELYVETRSKGFGPEVKRRIIIGNYVLSEQFSGDCYKKGMTVRARIQREIANVFKTYDLMICPTCPTAAFKLGSKVDDPLEMYLSDLFTTFVNLARIPSLSVPSGYKQPDSDGVKMPIGIQFAGAMFSESKILRIAQAWDDEHKDCGCPIK